MRAVLFFFLLLPMVIFAADLPVIGWGVVTGEADAYTTKGKKAGTVKGGELYSIYKQVSINKEPAFYVRVESNKNKPQCILPAEVCHNFLEATPPTDALEQAKQRARQSVCQEYYSALALRTSLETRAKDRYYSKSPTGKLKKAKEALAKIPAKDRTYEAAQKKAKTNGERLKYQELRKELRYNATGLQQEIKRLTTDAEQWEKDHPFDPSALHASGPWKTLTRQLENLKKDLKTFEIVPLKE